MKTLNTIVWHLPFLLWAVWSERFHSHCCHCLYNSDQNLTRIFYIKILLKSSNGLTCNCDTLINFLFLNIYVQIIELVFWDCGDLTFLKETNYLSCLKFYRIFFIQKKKTGNSLEVNLINFLKKKIEQDWKAAILQTVVCGFNV